MADFEFTVINPNAKLSDEAIATIARLLLWYETEYQEEASPATKLQAC